MTPNNLFQFKGWLLVNGCSTTNYVSKIEELLNSIPSLTEKNINNFIIKKKEDKLSEETLNTYIKSIRAYLKFLKKDIRTPKYFKPIKKIPQFITLEFLEKNIIPLIEDLFPKKELKIETLLYFMFYTGLRKSEIENLKRENFNFEEKEVKVYIPKTKEERLIPLNDRMIKFLHFYFDEEDEKNNAFNLGKGEINYIFKILKPNVKKVNLHPHIFRHSYAMHLQRNGFTTREIQSLLGHKNILTTIRYENADINLMKEKFNGRIK